MRACLLEAEWAADAPLREAMAICARSQAIRNGAHLLGPIEPVLRVASGGEKSMGPT